jgi:hypothetical protein
MEEKSAEHTCVQAALVVSLCPTTGKSNVGLTPIGRTTLCQSHIVGKVSLTVEEQDFSTRPRIIDPVFFEKVGERRGRGCRIWESCGRCRDDTNQKGDRGTAGLWKIEMRGSGKGCEKGTYGWEGKR